MKRTRLAMFAVAAAGALALSACGGGGAPEAGVADGNLEITDVTVGVLPLADYAAVYWAEENGLFDEEGLNVTLEPIQGGPVGIQRTVSGELDFAISNSISAAITQTQGNAPVTTVAFTSSLGEGSGIVFVTPESDIQTVEDLDGRTLGVNTTRNIGDVTFANLVNSEGLDVEPNWVEVPFPEMIAGVKAGSIDAGYTPEPFSSAARAAGMREVADVTTGPNLHLAAATIVASDQFVSQNPDTTAAFARAIYQAGVQMAADEDGVRSWLPGVATVPDEVAQTMVLPVYSPGMDLEALGAVADMLKEQGLIPDDYDVAEHVFELPEG